MGCVTGTGAGGPHVVWADALCGQRKELSALWAGVSLHQPCGGWVIATWRVGTARLVRVAAFVEDWLIGRARTRRHRRGALHKRALHEKRPAASEGVDSSWMM